MVLVLVPPLPFQWVVSVNVSDDIDQVWGLSDSCQYVQMVFVLKGLK